MSEDKSIKGKEDNVTIIDVGAKAGAAMPPLVKTFTVTWRNPETEELLSGPFTATRPSLGTISLIAVMKARMNGGERVSGDIDFLHEMMATLHYVLTDAPKWWQPESFYSVEPLQKVWGHVKAWLDSFLEAVAKRHGAAQADSRAPAPGGVPPAVVVPEVQPAQEGSAAG